MTEWRQHPKRHHLLAMFLCVNAVGCLNPSPDVLSTPQSHTLNQLESIVIPSVEFRDVNIIRVLAFLLDATFSDNGEGVGIPLDLTAPAETLDYERIFAPDASFDWKKAYDDKNYKITLGLRNCTLGYALDVICKSANLRYSVDQDGRIRLQSSKT